MKRIGIISSFAEPAALVLTETVLQFIEEKYAGEASVPFVFSNRGLGDDRETNNILQRLEARGVNLVVVSAPKFQPKLRKEAKRREKYGDLELIKEWRSGFDDLVLKRLEDYKTDCDLALGDWLIWGKKMCEARKGLNLHPALPDGPKGTWYNVVWELIQKRTCESGVMMHLITPELDRGPVATFCKYPIRGFGFDNLWHQLPKDPDEIDKLIEREIGKREKADFPLHAKIREAGFAREIPLILQTTAAFIEGKVRLEEGRVLNEWGGEIYGGHNLTTKVEGFLRPQIEGQYSFGKEVK